MRAVFHSLFFPFFLSFLILTTGLSCRQSGSKQPLSDSGSIKKNLPQSPVLSAEEAIKRMHIEKGFKVKLVAAEPLVVAPVAMNFDEKGRLWVVEMEDYMPDTLGTGEDNPSGKLVILSDKDGDGIMDTRHIFLDSLVLPRALCLLENGILVAESPNLWYYTIKNDKPVKKILVDSAYAIGGNVEHQPNSLFRALDNWIYNGESTKRYRKKGDQWLIERTHSRGQWGMTQDEQGRLYYNNNSENLLGDYFSPGLGTHNKNQKQVAGFDEKIVADLRVFPARPTPGVNRGYMEGILDDSLRLVNFTAACGPVIYAGHLFGKEFEGNAFVAEPSANLIKRDILKEEGYITTGKIAYENKEFLASEDERFRPVNLYNGPEGALYIVDMYRGIIQHKTYLTPYLKSQIAERQLTKPLSCGRIYKVVPVHEKEVAVEFTNDNTQLIELLHHPNGWVRNKAQHLLIDKKDRQVIPALRNILSNTDNPLAAIHALWTLEGLHDLKDTEVLPLLTQKNWILRMQALSAMPSLVDKNNYRQFIPVLQEMVHNNDTLAAPYIAFLMPSFEPLNKIASKDLLIQLIKKYPGNIYVADALISNFQDAEKAWYKEILTIQPDTSLILNKRLKKLIEDIALSKNYSNTKKLAEEYPKGYAIFKSVCQACHGKEGNGIASMAPPLRNSEWVQGDKNKFISIVLYGLTGPVTVAGKTYTVPEISGEMPGIGANKDFTNEDIAQLLSFLRNAWGNKADTIHPQEIINIRKKYKDRQKPFTVKELNRKL